MIGHIIGYIGNSPRDLGVIQVKFEGGHCLPSTKEGEKLFQDVEAEGYTKVHCYPLWRYRSEQSRRALREMRGAKL